MKNTDWLSTCVFSREKCDLYFFIVHFSFFIYIKRCKVTYFWRYFKENAVENANSYRSFIICQLFLTFMNILYLGALKIEHTLK